MNTVNPEHVLTIIDEYKPETVAMLQAFYSRSATPIRDRIGDNPDEQALKESLGKYYIGYGHASIGDCGSTTIFIENVSQLVTKAFQDHGLYSGQESSTRYLDYTSQPFVAPEKYGYLVQEVVQHWLDFYNQCYTW